MEKIDLKRLKLIHLSFFTAFAITLYVIENFLPKPLPFWRLGLSNIVILIFLFHKNYKGALFIMSAKIILGGFFSGLLLSPNTILAFAGSTLAFVLMIFAVESNINFSIIGISICGATAHNLGQLLIVRLLLIPENSIFYLTSILIIMGIATGLFTGFIADLFLKKVFYEKIDN